MQLVTDVISFRNSRTAHSMLIGS